MPEPISIAALVCAGGWMVNKASKFCIDVVVDEPAKAIIRRKRDDLVAHARKELLGATKASPSNDDLQRAFAMALCKAVEIWLAGLENSYEVRGNDRDELNKFIGRTRTFTSTLRSQAVKRHEKFTGAVKNSLLIEVICLAPETAIVDGDYIGLTARIAETFEALIVKREGQRLPEAARHDLSRRTRPAWNESVTLFGGRVMDEFVEILKSGQYEQATIAFNQCMVGEIRHTVKTLRGEVSGIAEENRKAITHLADICESYVDEFQSAIALLNENLSQQLKLTNKIDARLQRWVTLPLDLKVAFPRQMATNPFYNMTFEARKTEFHGREIELANLKHFLDDEKKIRWWQVSGGAGQGKSRLALELVDELGPEWHAGFLSKDVLEDTVWKNVEITRPTLCVIDYIASPDKAVAFGKVIEALTKRENGGFGYALPPIDQPIRFLLLERVGYGPNDGRQLNAATWIDPLRKKTEIGRALDNSVHDPNGSLELYDLSRDAMIAIGNSWRQRNDVLSLTEQQEQKLLDLLNMGRDHRSDLSRQWQENAQPPVLGLRKPNRRAWRPLFSMLFSTLIDKDAVDPESEYEILFALENVLDTEKLEWWKDGDGSQVNPAKCAINMACLATMIGCLDLNENNTTIDPNDNNPHPVSEFYGIRDGNYAMLDQVWMVLGQRWMHLCEPLPTFIARQPDLLGEFLLIWALKNDINETAFNRYGPERIKRLARDAWKVDPSACLEFMVRMREDFKEHPVTQSLATADIPECALDKLEGVELRFASYFGLEPLVQYCLRPQNNARVDQ